MCISFGMPRPFGRRRNSQSSQQNPDSLPRRQQMIWAAQYLIANVVSISLTGIIYPFPPFRTRKRAAFTAAGLFMYAVLLNALSKSLQTT